MKNLSILLVEDTPADQEIVLRCLAELNYDNVTVASSLKEANELLDHLRPDIAILDIYLGESAGGIELATRLYEDPSLSLPHIFLTSASDRSTFMIAKTTKPSGYLIKPFNPLELDYTLELAVENFAQANGELAQGRVANINSHFYVKHNKSLVKLSTEQISYVKVDGRYCEIYCNNKRYICRKSMSDLDNLMPKDQFVRTHRNYLMNINFVEKVTFSESTVYLSEGSTIPIGSSQAEKVRSLFPQLK